MSATTRQMVLREALRDDLDNANVRAFLRAIRLGEGTSDSLGYRRIVGGALFDSYADHPRKKVWIPRYKVWSSAAGAFQIIVPTWEGLVAQYGFGDFAPTTQDEAAVALVRGRKALEDVKAGRIAEAIHKCRQEWASLPGSEHGQRTEKIEAVLAVYDGAGGERTA